MNLLKKRLALFLNVTNLYSVQATTDWEKRKSNETVYLWRTQQKIERPEKGLFTSNEGCNRSQEKTPYAPLKAQVTSKFKAFFEWIKLMCFRSTLPLRLIYSNPAYIFCLSELQWQYQTALIMENMEQSQDSTSEFISGLSLANRMWAETYCSSWVKNIMGNIASGAWEVLVYELYKDAPWMFYVKPTFYAANVLFVWLIELCFCNTEKPKKLEFISKDIAATIVKSLLPQIIMSLIGIYFPKLYYSFMIVFINIIIRLACSKLHSLITNPTALRWEGMYLSYDRTIFIPSMLKSFYALIQCVDVISVCIWYIQNYFSEEWTECFDVMAWLSEIILEMPNWCTALYIAVMLIVYLYNIHQKIKIYNELSAELPPPSQTVLVL